MCKVYNIISPLIFLHVLSVLASGSHELVLYVILLRETVMVKFDNLMSFVVKCPWVLKNMFRKGGMIPGRL